MAKNLLRSIVHEHRKAMPAKLESRDMIEKIESGYLADNRNGFKTKKSFSPSNLVYNHGECPRYWYLAFHGADFKEDNTPKQIANMKNGTLAHERIQQAMEDSGILISKEEKITLSDPPIYGYQDVELEWDNAPVPGEIKTTNDRAFGLRKESGKALSYHIAQLAIYMKIKDRKKGVIIYENKNDHELLVIPVDMDETLNAWVDQLFDWCRTVKKASDENTLPVIPYRSNSKVCKACPLNEFCHNQPEGDITLPRLEQLA